MRLEFREKESRSGGWYCDPALDLGSVGPAWAMVLTGPFSVAVVGERGFN